MSNDLQNQLNRLGYGMSVTNLNRANANFNLAITNTNPKRDRAHAIAAEVRARRPEMQVKRITKGQP